MNLMHKAVGLCMALGTLQGCTNFGVGSSEFACPGMPSGVQCMSTRDVYHATNNGNVPAPMNPSEEGKKNQQKDTIDGKTPLLIGEQSSSASYNPSKDDIHRRYVEANLPYQPIPIRTPSQTMRIYVAPYEDKEGDLLVPGLVYTDVEKRRWVIGSQVAQQRSSLRPLQVINHDIKSDASTNPNTIQSTGE